MKTYYNQDFELILVEPTDKTVCLPNELLINDESFSFNYSLLGMSEDLFEDESRGYYMFIVENYCGDKYIRNGRLSRVTATECDGLFMIDDFTGEICETGTVMFYANDKWGRFESLVDHGYCFDPYKYRICNAHYTVNFSDGLVMDVNEPRNGAFYSCYSDDWYDNDCYDAYDVAGYGTVEDSELENFYYCEHCDRYVCEDMWNYDYECCEDCAYEREEEERYFDDIYVVEENLSINPYDCSSHESDYYSAPKDRMRMFTEDGEFTGNRTDFKGMGIELEVDNGSDKYALIGWLRKVLPSAEYKHDGSLDNGFEIVTPPATYEAFKGINFEPIFEKIKSFGFKSHETTTCGLHIHISRALMTDKKCNSPFELKAETREAVGKLAAFMDYFESDVSRIARRNPSRWAAVVHSDYSKDSENYLPDLIAKMDMMRSHSERYHAVNNSNDYTVEIRVFRGTLNLDSFKACVDIAYNLAKNAKDVKDIKNLSEWFKGMSESTFEYMKSRNAFEAYFE